MAIYTSIRSGSTSDTNPATNPWGNAVLPAVGDKVIIATGHTVTIDGTVNWGNDTSTGIIINGTLKHSRAVNTKITARGDIVVGATGTYDAGTEADPMPSNVTAETELNDSAVMSANKWGFRTDETTNTWAGVRLWGATKTRFTDFAVQAGATDTVITVTDATGWNIGDKLVIESTVAQSSIGGIVYRAITGIAGNIVTLSSSVVAIKPIGTKIMNLSSNVKVYGKTGNTYPSYFSIRHASGFTSIDAIEIGETEFYCGGTTTDVMKQGVLSLTWQSTATTTDSVKRIYRPIIHNIWSISGATVTKVNPGSGNNLLNLFGNQAYRYIIEEPILSSEDHYAMTWYNGTNTDIRAIKCIRANGIAVTGYSQGPVGTSITGGYMSCMHNLAVGTGVIVNMSDMTINGVTNCGSQTAYGIYGLTNCTFGPLGDFTGTNSANFGNGANAPIVMDGCTFQATGSATFSMTRNSSNLNNVASGFSFTRRNINNDITLHDRYTYGGKQERDNSIYSNSLSSLRLDSWYSANPNVFTSSVNVNANETLRILGKCRYNTAYGTTYPATITVSGMGITPVVFTCPTSGADTWFPIDLTVTNPNAYPGTFTLTYQVRSTANTESASVWFSGITIPDYVTVSRHYGFQFLNQTYQNVNQYITESDESIVGAYSGISIDHTTDTITISSSHSINEVYDYVYYDLTLNANLNEPEYFTTDGSTYTTTYNIINNSALTGSGTLITTGTYTGSGTTTLVVKDSVGVRCKITSGSSPFTIKGATIAYEADITEKIVTVVPNTDVSFVMYKLGYKPQLFTINSGALGGTFNISMLDITEAVDTGLNVAPIIALTSTTVDMSGYHIFFGEMELSLEQMKAVVHRLMKYENYFDAVIATSDDSIVEVRSDEIRVNKPLFTLERAIALTIADRVQLNGYINISNAVAIDPLYIINPGDSDGLYVTYLTVKPGIDAQYLAGVVWENATRTLTEIYTPSQIADAVWDEPLTGATHNVPTSAGRRLRQLGQIVIHDGIAQGAGTGNNQIQLDTGASSLNGAYDPSEIAIVFGTGAGQSRLIIDYIGSTRMATVDRNWKVNPDDTSEFIIYVNSGREHVNEGLAQGGTANTITLNANASSYDDTYIGQTIFLRSGNGEDQVARVIGYNGATKVANISTSMDGNGWSVIPDATTGYVMLPNYHIESGSGGLTTDEHDRLFSLPTSIAGGIVDYTSKHEDIISKYEKLLLKKLSELLKELPKTDISPLALALSSIKPVDLTDVVTGLGAMNTQIAGFSKTMKTFYEKEKKDIETKYANEIDKKNSLLAENEYNLQKKQSEIDEMSKNVKELSEEIEEIKKTNEAELKEVENAYLNKIEIVKIAKEEEIVEKIIPLLTP